jgi:hypothetical protein
MGLPLDDGQDDLAGGQASRTRAVGASFGVLRALEGAVATVGGNLGVRPRRSRPGRRPLEAETWVRLPLADEARAASSKRLGSARGAAQDGPDTEEVGRITAS